MIMIISFMGFLYRTAFARFYAGTFHAKFNNLIGAEIGGTLGLMIKDDKCTSKSDNALSYHKNDTQTRNVTHLRTKDHKIQN